MSKRNDFLVEIFTEELPPTILLKLGEHFSQQIQEQLKKNDLDFDGAVFFATPRRIAVLVKNLIDATPEQVIERRGPPWHVAFDAAGNPTPSCVGFARTSGVTPSALQKITTLQGEWVGYAQRVPGKPVTLFLPVIVEHAIAALPIRKQMRWGESQVQFLRPVKSVLMLYGSGVVECTILGCQAGRVTYGHRFHAPKAISIPNPGAYESLLETEGHVIANFIKRRDIIQNEAIACVKKQLGPHAFVLISNEELLDEVTGLVEWPSALCGCFDDEFLGLPKEVLISSMQDHQRYFPVVTENKQLLAHFVTISNIQSLNPKRVIQGNERVLRARLSDAAFFYSEDQKESLSSRLERLKGVIFQASLGTLYDKAIRLDKLSRFLAEQMHINKEDAARAGLLAKTDLTTNMVMEFPELQGVMGGYYARHAGEKSDIADAIVGHYMPRFARDAVPSHVLGQIVSLADKIDTLIGTFGINQIPTGDKDPYGLRRAALGVLRILIEKQINLDLKDALVFAAGCYVVVFDNGNVIEQVLHFIHERLRVWYQDQGITPDVFAAVAILGITNPAEAHERIKAVQAFKKLNAAASLSVANKRVSNILTKYTEKIDAKTIEAAFFEFPAEEILATELETKSALVANLYQARKYDQVLLQLADLREPIDHFFDQVMVMTDDKQRRENRLLLLKKLRALFLQVADIALLQP